MTTQKLENLMSRNPATAWPGMSLAEAAKLMWDHDCGFLPVVDADTQALCGVLTDRDACMAGMTRGRALQDLPVAEAMSRAVHALRPEDTIAQAEELMARYQVRRVPVVDAARHILGVISVNDLARAVSNKDEQRDLTRTLAEICRHRQLPVVASAPAAASAPAPATAPARTPRSKSSAAPAG